VEDMTIYYAGILKVLSQSTRMTIVDRLRDEERCVADLVRDITTPEKEMSQPNLSRHLAVMLSYGILDLRKDGHKTLYRLKHRLAVLALVDYARTRSNHAQVLTAIAQITRLRIVEALRDGESLAPAIITAVAGEQSNTARHLSQMRTDGVVDSRRVGFRSAYWLVDRDYVLNLVDAARAIVTLTRV